MSFALAILAAVAENGVIGRAGELPWRLPDEMRHLRALSTGHCLLMGRKTWESIGRPLPKRTSIVITRSAALPVPEGVHVVHGFDEALARARELGDERPFAFGGATIYALALERAEHLYLTRVHARPEGDAFFPPVDWQRWRIASSRPHPADARHSHAFTLQHWVRRA